ncbi:mechanosensitive ion channel family protein [Thiococcus pfennigii]|uniref:mechanosensitive ion channel family protein n=1 Tax=Thiococcus pfennigii TaxID=1057 RepID=UPI0019077FED|nr:mechanosensitive ion channel family protein [Thiococcus pfennigii]MBK1701508.1 mechanosensitive ion channel protein MscS [Thiococcus pfennigii]
MHKRDVPHGWIPREQWIPMIGYRSLVVGLISGWLLIVASPRADELTDLLTGKKEEAAISSEQVISAGTSEKDDARIRKRLQAIYAEIQGLKSLSVRVSGGIVFLSGEVESAATETMALAFARKVEGVVKVESTISVNRELQPRLRAMWAKLVKLAQQVLVGLPLFLLALGVLALFWITGRWLAARQGVFRRIAPNHFIAHLLGQLTHLSFVIAGLVMALSLLDATALLSTILGAAGIIGLAVGFAVRDTVENYIASILLSLRNPFQVSDFVDVGGHQGNVVKLTSRATILLSPDGNHIRIPNATVFKAVIVNYTRNPERRFEFDVGVDTDQDLPMAQSLALRTLLAVTGVLHDPKPLVVVQSLGDSNVILRCYAWIDQMQVDFLKVRSEAIRAVKSAFDGAGVVMPEPIYKVRLFDAGSAAAASAEREDRVRAKGPPEVRRAAAVGSIATGDVSVDRTIEEKVEASGADDDTDNLLSPDAAREV